MELSPDAESLRDELRRLAPPEDVEIVLASAAREATRRHHPRVVRGHIVAVLVRAGADPDLLSGLSIDPTMTEVQIADLIKSELDRAIVETPRTASAETVTFRIGEVRFEDGAGVEPCPSCGDTERRRFQTRRTPRPDGGRGYVMARVAVCGACGIDLGPG